MHNRTTTWRATALVALALLLAPWASAQDARTSGRQAPAPDRVLPAPAEVKGEDSPLNFLSAGSAGQIDLFRTGGPDLGGYSFIDSNEPGGPVFSFQDISSTGTLVTLANYAGCTAGDAADEGRASVTLPFTFPFYGANYTTAYIYANGVIGFDPALAACTFSNGTIPNSTTQPNQFIGPFWDDLDDGPSGNIRTQTVGGNFVIQWTNVQKYTSSTTPQPLLTFQAILEPDGDILYQYQSFGSGAVLTSTTVGVEGSGAAGQGLQVSANETPAYLAPGLAVAINSDPPPPPIPAAYASSGIELAFANATAADDASLWFVGVYKVVVTGNTGTIPLNAATMNLIGTMPAAAISEARLFFTGTSTAAPTTSTPTVGPALLNPGTSALTFTATTALNMSPGTNYMWLVFRINSAAVVGNTYSASFGSVTVGGTPYTPSPAHDGNFNFIPAPPANDALVAARPVYEVGFSDFGANAAGTVEASEAEASCAFSALDGANSIWWKYTPGTSGSATFGAEGFDTILAVYTGTAFPLTEVGCADDLAATGVEEVTVAVTGGTTYYVRVTGYNGSTGTVNLTLDAAAPAPTETYTVTEPASGLVVLGNKKTWVRWTGAGVPNRDQYVRIFGRQDEGDDEMIYLGRFRNIGRAKVRVPADVTTGSTYVFVVAHETDLDELGVSNEIITYTTGEQFVFTEPDGGETWQRGTTKTIGWTTPPSAPDGTVTINFFRGSGLLLATYPGETDDGSLDVTTSGSLTTGDFYFTIVSDADPAFFGQSNLFSIQRFEVTAPVEGATWATGSSQSVSWTAGANPAGQIRVALRNRTTGVNTVVSGFGAYTPQSRTFTVPSLAAGLYEVQLIHRFTPPGGAEVRQFVYSNEITITNAAAPEAPAARHFAAPAPAPEATETMLAVTGLAEGTEVGVYAGRTLLASGVVEEGEAYVAVPSEVIDSELLAETGSTEESALAFGSSVALEVRALIDGEEAVVGRTTFASGEVIVIDAQTEAAITAGTTPEVFAVRGVSPNPATSTTTVRFTVPSATRASVVLYDLLGRVVQTALDTEVAEGAHEVALTTGDLPAGVYVVRVTAGAESATTRMTVVR